MNTLVRRVPVLVGLGLIIVSCSDSSKSSPPGDLCSCLEYVTPVMQEQIANWENKEKLEALRDSANSDLNGRRCQEIVEATTQMFAESDLSSTERNQKILELFEECESYTDFNKATERMWELQTEESPDF